MNAGCLTPERIETLARAALIRHGASEGQAGALAARIGAAERDGLKSHGLLHLPTYCEHLTCGKVLGGAEPQLSHPAAACLAVDACNGFAHAAIDLGLPELIDLARAQGIARLAIRKSYNCGALGSHTERVARAGAPHARLH
jgi:(2R)-3-sulfolactate dehydrogenase (NADP+)